MKTNLAANMVIRNKNSERYARNPALLARPQIFVLHQILQHVSSSEFLTAEYGGMPIECQVK